MNKNRLICHPQTPCSLISDFFVEIEPDDKGNLHLSYQLIGALTQIRIPEQRSTGFLNGLWEHTCFEAFIAAEPDPAYHEFNFSPSGHYAAYAFDSYRKPSANPAHALEPIITLAKSSARCSLGALVFQANLPANSNALPFRVGLSAVIELLDGSKSYWALQHPADHPDFHRREGWILSLNCSEFLS